MPSSTSCFVFIFFLYFDASLFANGFAFIEVPSSRPQTIGNRADLPPPPSPTSNPADDIFREIRRSWPVPLQNWLTESGILRNIQDCLTFVGIPSLITEYPESFWDFLHLSTSCRFVKYSEDKQPKTARPPTRMSKVQYGMHKSQFIDLFEPSISDGVVFFVHGGAWGSGMPWMYRLVSLPFLSQNKTVAIVGYRTYPDTNLDGQVADVGAAIKALIEERPDLLDAEGRIAALIGHSSGSHISLLYLLESARDVLQGISSTPIQQFIGISGVYCIESHFLWEIGRGVDQISAMRVACSPFKEASPAYRLECKLVGKTESKVMLDEHIPDITIVHGTDDNVVRYTQSFEIVDSIRSSLKAPERCRAVILKGVGHADTVLDLMVGGVTRDVLETEILGRNKCGKGNDLWVG